MKIRIRLKKMGPETWRNIFQIVIYLGTAFITYLVFKKGNPEYIGLVIILAATIGLNIFNKSIESKKEKRIETLTKERDAALKKVKENTDVLLAMNSFNSQIDNEVFKLYLILDLDSTPIANNFDDIKIYLYFQKLDILFSIKTFMPPNPPSNDILYFKTLIVNGKNFKNDPLTTSNIHNFKNSSEFIFDLYSGNKKLPKNLKIRDLNNEFFKLIISSKYTEFIKSIKINANNWNIFEKDCSNDDWRKFSEAWLPDSSNLSIIYDRYDSKFYDNLRIYPTIKGATYFEIFTKKFENNLKASKNNVQQLLSNIDEKEGTLIIDIDNKWLVKDGRFINYLPLTVKGSFKIKIFRDTDNLLKVLIGNSYSKNVTLICRKTDIFQPDQKIHSLYITWLKNNFTLYIDGKLVDSVNGNK